MVEPMLRLSFQLSSKNYIRNKSGSANFTSELFLPQLNHHNHGETPLSAYKPSHCVELLSSCLWLKIQFFSCAKMATLLSSHFKTSLSPSCNNFHDGLTGVGSLLGTITLHWGPWAALYLIIACFLTLNLKNLPGMWHVSQKHKH